MVVDPPLNSWPKYLVSTLQYFSVILNFICHLLHCLFVSQVEELFLQFAVVAQLVACMPTVRVTPVLFSSRLFL
jgi:hypothetical protein